MTMALIIIAIWIALQWLIVWQISRYQIKGKH